MVYCSRKLIRVRITVACTDTSNIDVTSSSIRKRGFVKIALAIARRRRGRLELADKGTLFLDEIGDMSLPTQAKILRVLQESEFERMGGTGSLKVDVRLLAATHKNLQKMIEEGTFRQDLFFRLSVVPLHQAVIYQEEALTT